MEIGFYGFSTNLLVAAVFMFTLRYRLYTRMMYIFFLFTNIFRTAPDNQISRAVLNQSNLRWWSTRGSMQPWVTPHAPEIVTSWISSFLVRYPDKPSLRTTTGRGSIRVSQLIPLLQEFDMCSGSMTNVDYTHPQKPLFLTQAQKTPSRSHPFIFCTSFMSSSL